VSCPIFLCRPSLSFLCRVGWASNNISDRHIHQFLIEKTSKKATSQVHVIFSYPFAKHPVTEDFLRKVFQDFGMVLDVTINRVEFNFVSDFLLLLFVSS
jgi:RNA recognition motif-containing protein